MELFILFGTLFVLLILGVPVAFSLGLSSLATMFYLDIPPVVAFQRMAAGLNVFALMAIPLFIFAGNLMNSSGLTTQLIRLANSLVGHLRGGLGYVNVVSSVFFAGVNGSAVADTSALGSLLVPAMKKEGYSTSYAAGLTAASSQIGPIIPPSIFMILYASLTNTSVGDLFLAGVIPGLLLGGAFVAMNYLYVRKAGIQSQNERSTLRGILTAFWFSAPALIAPFIIVASIVFGFVTPTESGALIVAYALILGMINRTLNWQKLKEALVDTALLSCSIFVIIAASAVVSWLLAYAQLPNQLVEYLAPFKNNPTMVLLILSLITFFIGMLMEEVSALMLLTPVFFPVAIASGIDPVHLGVVITVNITIALITPPMGACVFVAAAVSKLQISEMFKSIWPFVLVAVFVQIFVICFPALTLSLPGIFQ